ncbi:MAG: ABC transporter permease [Monoglobales bacterium]
MNLKQSFSLAVKSLLASKMRSFLTMLGIIIGIAAVISLTSHFNGMTSEVIDQFEKIGTTTTHNNSTGRGGNRRVEPEQFQELADKNPEVILAVSPNISTRATIKNGSDNQTTTCLGVSEVYAALRGLELESGRFLQYIDVERRQKNCVIGTYIVNNMFDGQDPIGEVIKIGGSNFNIIGVLKETADSKEGSDDDRIIIPYTLARTLTRSNIITSYVLSATTVETVDKATELTEEMLLKTYASTDYFTVTAMSAIIDTVNEMTGMMSAVLAGIAGISLLVGGIGIMNIMLVSVTERTREIGIRKSLGAKRRDIMSQFLVEAATTSIIGGIIGIILGLLIANGLASLINIKAAPTAGSIVIAFGVSALIGISFGYFPANKAAKLDPIDALRYD